MTIVARGLGRATSLINITVIGGPLLVELEDADLSIYLEPAAFTTDLGDPSLSVALTPSSFSVTLEPTDLSVVLGDGSLEAEIG